MNDPPLLLLRTSVPISILLYPSKTVGFCMAGLCSLSALLVLSCGDLVTVETRVRIASALILFLDLRTYYKVHSRMYRGTDH